MPRFEFARQMRNDSLGTPLKLEKNEIAVFEGIHALNDDIAGRQAVHIRPVQHQRGRRSALQGDLDAADPQGRPGL